MLKLVLPLKYALKQSLHAVVDAVLVAEHSPWQLLRDLKHHVSGPLCRFKLLLNDTEKDLMRVETVRVAIKATSVNVYHILVLAEEKKKLVARRLGVLS